MLVTDLGMYLELVCAVVQGALESWSVLRCTIASYATNWEAIGSVQMESAPKLQQTFVFVTRAGASRINQSNGGLFDSARISRGEQPSVTTATDIPSDGGPLSNWLNGLYLLPHLNFDRGVLVIIIRNSLELQITRIHADADVADFTKYYF